MIEVIPHGNGFAWQLISAAGVVIAYHRGVFPCTRSAFSAAKDYRARFLRRAAGCDHRQGACI